MRHVLLSLVCLAIASAVTAQDKTEHINGYAEWRQGTEIIVDGQRVRSTAATKFKGSGDAKDFAAIPLGYEVEVTGTRRSDGVVEARTVDASPNGLSQFEAKMLLDVRREEASMLDAGFVAGDPQPHRVLTRGPDVDRVKRIALRLIPPYKSKDDFRFYVVEDRAWNAYAAANGMIVVNQGLLGDLDDDELALVLGHELVHATHEHTRKERKRILLLRPLFEAGGAAASTTVGRGRTAALSAISLAGVAASNGYSRDMEDQADRVGLRYAYEAGFDITKAPRLWNRRNEKSPDGGRVENFLYGSHSLHAARAENLRRQIAVNYPQLLKQMKETEGSSRIPSESILKTSPAPASPKEPSTEGPRLDVWAERHYSSWENVLQSELSVNGQLVEVFSSDRSAPLSYLRSGWNVVTIKTTPQTGAANSNGLRFSIGPVEPGTRRGGSIMKPVLWEFRNDTDWSLSNGEFRHRLGPAVKEIALSFSLYFAGLQHEGAEPGAGDYILQGKAQSELNTAPVTATIFVNGTPLNTFTSGPRAVVITSLLHAGRNEIRLVSRRVVGVVEDNDIAFTLFGPVEWDVNRNEFVGSSVAQFSSMHGWRRDPRNGSLINSATPASDSVERTVIVILREAPGAQSAAPAIAPDAGQREHHVSVP